MKKPDYCDFWTPEWAAVEDTAWQREKAYVRYANLIRGVMNERSLRSVVEIGCGAGYVGDELKSEFDYLGMDGSSIMIDMARSKFPKATFAHANLRDIEWENKADLVVCFAVMKHFGLADWKQMFHKVVRSAPLALVHMQVRKNPYPSVDDGTLFHHHWINEAELSAAIAEIGYQTVSVLEETDAEVPGAPVGVIEQMLLMERVGM